MARIDKINEEVKRELANIIRELKDTRIPLMTSVVTVNVTNDLRYAKAYISVMGDEETKKKAMQGLKSAAGFIRRELGKRIDLRYTPEFVFELDDSIEHGANIERLQRHVITAILYTRFICRKCLRKKWRHTSKKPPKVCTKYLKRLFMNIKLMPNTESFSVLTKNWKSLFFVQITMNVPCLSQE